MKSDLGAGIEAIMLRGDFTALSPIETWLVRILVWGAFLKGVLVVVGWMLGI